MIATIHVAGEVRLGGLYQECARCGHVLIDYTGQEVAVVTGPGEETQPLRTWPVGAQVGLVGVGVSYRVPDRPLDDDERECRATS